MQIVFCSGLTFLAACADRKDVGADMLAPLNAGSPRDSVVLIFGTGPLQASFAADSARLLNGYRRDQYFHDGKLLEVLYYRELPGNVAEPVDPDKETPVVLQGGKVVGWGWRFYSESGDSFKLPPVSVPEE
jgi:hypothetical protein